MDAKISPKEAMESLKGTTTGEKNELLFSKAGRNYHNEPDIFKKGTVVVRAKGSSIESQKYKSRDVVATHEDIIGDTFWKVNAILN